MNNMKEVNKITTVFFFNILLNSLLYSIQSGSFIKKKQFILKLLTFLIQTCYYKTCSILNKPQTAILK